MFSSASKMLRPMTQILRFNSGSTQLKEATQTVPIIAQEKTDMPVNMMNPYIKERQKCILCKHRITPNYKNVRLLSQFVSRFTGKIYSRNITGLCKRQQLAVEMAINRAIKAGIMAGYYREPKYAHDPKLFNPDNPFRPHRF